MTNNLHLNPIKQIPNSTVYLPGSKSIANRVLILASIANGISIIDNVPDVSEDVQLMLEALTTLGVRIEKLSTNEISCSSKYKIHGTGGKFTNTEALLFCGNSGTSIRFLSACLAFCQGEYTLTGIQRMKERPIKDLINAVTQVGAQITYVENNGYPPIKINAFVDNKVDRLNISGSVSSQYLTGVLMALPLLGRTVTVKIIDELISKPYVDITLNLLKLFGVNVVVNDDCYTFSGLESLTGIEYTVEPDASSASYFLAIGALKGQVTVANLSSSSLQGDKNFAQVLAKMGASVQYNPDSITVSSGVLNGININMHDMPDVAMTIATLGLFANSVIHITGINSWKVKETDRILAMYNELTKLGATVTYTDDSITIKPPANINQGVAIDTYNDHRMAMCFSLVAVHGIDVIINDYHCVGKTFANYFDVFDTVCN